MEPLPLDLDDDAEPTPLPPASFLAPEPAVHGGEPTSYDFSDFDPTDDPAPHAGPADAAHARLDSLSLAPTQPVLRPADPSWEAEDPAGSTTPRPQR